MSETTQVIFQQGWTGHGRCALVRSVPGSTNNVPYFPSHQSVTSSSGLVTASISGSHNKWDVCSVCYPTMNVNHWSRLGTGVFHFPQGSRQEQRHCPSLPIPSPLQEGQGVQGILGFAVLSRQWAGAVWCSHGTKDLLPQGHRVSRGCRFSREGKFSAGRGGWALRGSSRVITRGNYAGEIYLLWRGKAICMHTADGTGTARGFIGKE